MPLYNLNMYLMTVFKSHSMNKNLCFEIKYAVKFLWKINWESYQKNFPLLWFCAFANMRMLKFQELRAKHRAKGHRWICKSRTGVVVRAFHLSPLEVEAPVSSTHKVFLEIQSYIKTLFQTKQIKSTSWLWEPNFTRVYISKANKNILLNLWF